MDDFDEELRDIKREIIESRGLIIKTNNLTNALAADLKSIGKRQQKFERRAFWNSAAANLLFVVVVLTVVKLAWDARIDFQQNQMTRSTDQVEKLQAVVTDLQEQARARSQAEAAAAAFYELLRTGDKKELIDGFESVRKQHLTRAEHAFFRDAVDRARSQLSIGTYHEGTNAARSGRWHEAVLALEESLRFSPNAAHAPAAQLDLARGYRHLNRQRDAIPILTKLSEASSNARLLDDAMFLLAESLIDIQAYNDAKTTLRKLIRRYPKSPYVNDAKMALSELTSKH